MLYSVEDCLPLVSDSESLESENHNSYGFLYNCIDVVLFHGYTFSALKNKFQIFMTGVKVKAWSIMKFKILESRALPVTVSKLTLDTVYVLFLLLI